MIDTTRFPVEEQVMVPKKAIGRHWVQQTEQIGVV